VVVAKDGRDEQLVGLLSMLQGLVKGTNVYSDRWRSFVDNGGSFHSHQGALQLSRSYQQRKAHHNWSTMLPA